MVFGSPAFAPWSPLALSRCSTEATQADLDQAPAAPGCKADLEQPLLAGFEEPHPGRQKQLMVGLAVAGAFLCGLMAGAGAMMSISIWEKPPDFAVHSIRPFSRRKQIWLLERSVWVSVPSRLSANSPAVIVLHGSEDHPLAIANASRFEDVAELSPEPFLSVFPDMEKPGGEEWGYAKDSYFFQALADTLVSDFAVNRKEIYVCGHSAGGTMALYLQNNLPGVIRAAASVEAAMGHTAEWDHESSGRPTLLIWNHNDPVLKSWDLHLSGTIKMLRRHDSTNSAPSFSLPVPLLNNSAVRYAQMFLWGTAGSVPQTAVVSWQTENATHSWSNPYNVPGSFDAAFLIWDFFRSTRVEPDGMASN